MTNDAIYRKTYISTATTTQVFTGPGTLHSIVVNTTAAGAIAVIDGIAGSTANVASLKASIVEGTYLYDCALANGLRIVTAGASDITVTWTQG